MSRSYHPILSMLTISLLMSMLLLGCNKSDEVAHYRVPKAKTQNASTPSNQPTNATTYTWTVPDTWQPGKASSMRIGSYSVINGDQSADLSVVQLPGHAGGTLANLNRWRGQLNLEPVNSTELEGLTEHIDSPAGTIELFDIQNPAADHGILAAVLTAPDHVLFFKLTGPQPVLDAHKDEFVAFLKTITPNQSQAQSPTQKDGA